MPTDKSRVVRSFTSDPLFSILLSLKMQRVIYEPAGKNLGDINRASWSGGKGTSAEVPAIMSSSSDHSGFDMVFVWSPRPFSPVPVKCGGIVELIERSGYLDYKKKKFRRYKRKLGTKDRVNMKADRLAVREF